MEFGFTEDQQLLRDTVREFAESEILPNVMDFDESQEFPREVMAKAAELGLLGILFPEKYDGVVDVVKVDVDANPGLSQAYQVMSIPTIAYFKPGDQPKGVVGFQPMEQLEKKFGLNELAAADSSEASNVA